MEDQKETVQRCKCGDTACKGEHGGAARGHVGKVTQGQALARGDMLARGHGDKGR